MTRSVYVAGIGRGDGRQVVELGVMELLTRQVDRVGVFRPLVHEGPDQVLGLLRARYRLAQPPGSAHGMSYAEAAALLAERGTDELVTRLVDRFHEVARAYEAVLVLGTDYADTQLPAELSLNARLANEFGASVLPVVGGAGQSAESVAAEVRNARRAFAALGCEVIATIANRVDPAEARQAAALLGPGPTGQGHAAPGRGPGDGSPGAEPESTPDGAVAGGAIPGPGPDPDPDSAPDVAPSTGVDAGVAAGPGAGSPGLAPGAGPERGPGRSKGRAVAAAAAAAELAFVVPEEPALTAPTVAQMADALGAEVLLGDVAGLARDIRGFVFGGAMLPTFLTALTDGCLVITPGDRADLVVGALASHAAGAPPIAGLLLTLGQRPGPETMALAARLAPGTPVLSVPGDSFSTATALSGLESRLTAATPRKAEIALGLFERHVDTAALTRRLSVARGDRVTPMMFEHALIERARAARRHVVLPEGTEERVLRAAEVLLRRDVCDLTLLGEESAVRKRVADLGLDLGLDREEGGARIVDPRTSPLRETFAEQYAALRAHRGATYELAYDVVADVSYFGTLMVRGGLADGMVSGAAHSTAATIRPAFQVIGTRPGGPGASIVSSVFFMCLADRVLVYGDCAVNPDPNAEQLADIAIQSAATAARFGVEPRVAMLSYSTGTSGSGADVDKVREATELVRRLRPELMVEGPIQYDAAVEPSVAATKLPGSDVAGRASVLIFPDLNTGNNTYKAVQRSAGAVAVGPVLQGLRKPVNDLSRGALVQDIVNTVAITAIQAQDVDKETR